MEKGYEILGTCLCFSDPVVRQKCANDSILTSHMDRSVQDVSRFISHDVSVGLNRTELVNLLTSMNSQNENLGRAM